jgi:general secretion pathway protein D
VRALGARGRRFRGRAIEFALVFAMCSAGCTSGPTIPVIPANPAALDDVRSADLSEKQARPVKQVADADGKARAPRQFETYPGNDKFGAQLASSATVSPESLVPVSFTRGQRTGEGYQLNFENASLVEVTKVILGDTLKVPYYYDPRVQGQITLSTGRAVTREELLAVLESALKMNNGVLISSEGGYRIAPAGEAAAGGDGALSLSREDATTPGYGVSVLALQNVSADAMTRLLENFVAKGGSLRAEMAGNLLMVRGPSRERQSLMDVAMSFDVDWLKGQSAGIYPLIHTTPEEMITELTQLMQADHSDLTAKMVRFQPVQRLNAVLVLARQSNHLNMAATWIQRLDRSNPAGQSLYVYRVENGKAQDLAILLNDTLGTGTSARRAQQRSEVAPGRDISSLSAKATQPTVPLAGATPVANQPTGMQPAAVQQPILPLRRPETGSGTAGVQPTTPSGGPEVRIVADDINNLLLIKAGPSDYDRIVRVLRQVDRPPLQVMINATIAEVTLNDSLQYGVQVFLKGKNLSGGLSLGDALVIQPKLPGLNMLLGSNIADPKVVLDALATVTEVKVVSSPSVVVVDNQPALLKVGDEVPISTQQATVLENPAAPIVSSIQFRSTGVILKVIPRVNSNGLVTMDIEQEISAVVSQNTQSQTLTPTISQRRIASTISVYSGQMVALGGLISEQRNVDKSGLPFLMHVPVLSDIVGNTQKGMKRTELIVFIKPQVIRNSRDARAVAEELRSRLQAMAPRSDDWRPRPYSR